jgi:DNA-binding beta-propeller fold protein YncE
VRKCTLDGRVLMTIGVPGKPAPFMSGQPFCRCTHTALSPKGEIYVTDGYGNAQVHKYTPDGKYLSSWGKCGIGEGEFNLPHNVHCDADGWVYVADRENHRVQVFDGNGRFETAWSNVVHRPSALHMTTGTCPLCFIGEVGPYLGSNRGFPNLGPRISILSNTGKVLARLGSEENAHGQAPGQFMSPHGIAVDSHGDIYVGEVSVASWPSLFPGQPRPDNLRSLQKLVKVE